MNNWSLGFSRAIFFRSVNPMHRAQQTDQIPAQVATNQMLLFELRELACDFLRFASKIPA